MKRWDGSAHVDNTIAKRWDGTAWVDLTVAKRWDGTAWIDIPLPGGAPPATVAVTVNDASAVGSVTNNSLFVTVNSNSITATAAGGTGPYTYSWVKLSGHSAIAVSNAAAASVYFTANVARDAEYTATYRVTATDTIGEHGSTTVTVTLIHNSTL